jgi:hypothetical protein
MSHRAEPAHASTLARRLSRWWENWRSRRAAIAELACCGSAEVERIARDVGVNAADLRTLAGKWPGSAELLGQRLAQLKLDESDLRHEEPQAFRDLQRVCTMCASKGRCEHDLANRPANPAWQSYCPNTLTLKALAAERSERRRKSPSA